VRVRGYVSCVVGCPYEGPVAPEKVAEVAAALFEMGCEEISLGDTIGVGTPRQVVALLEAVAKRVPLERLAGHFHDTYGMAVANVYAAWRFGVATFDASVAGLGGCPYAKGASGNVATEELVYLFDGLGVETGVDLKALTETAWWVSGLLGREPASRVARALGGACGAPQP
jgi:hydroxymethylglutaryl-CoA lyase